MPDTGKRKINEAQLLSWVKELATKLGDEAVQQSREGASLFNTSLPYRSVKAEHIKAEMLAAKLDAFTKNRISALKKFSRSN